MTRIPIVAANWKMHLTLSQAEEFVNTVKNQIPDEEIVESIIIPQSLFIDRVLQAAFASPILVGAQNAYLEDQGAFTGEVSPKALSDMGVKYLVLGHSERRQLFAESDAMIHDKVQAAIANELVPILCCGESLEQHEAGLTKEFVWNQVKQALTGLESDAIKKIVIAYEPIWAIGTGKTASSEEANEIIASLRQSIAKEWGADIADAIRILYGGSVKPNNIKEFINQSDIDGALVGGASLEPASYIELVQAVAVK